jgi:hypothetical protein
MRKAVFTTALIMFTALSIPLTAAPASAAQNPVPIPQQPGFEFENVPQYLGEPAVPVPVDASPIPPNPFMSPNPWSAIHNDTYMSDTYPTSAALGHRPVVLSTWLGTPRDPSAAVVVMTFDRAGRIVAGAVVTDLAQGTAHVRLTLIQPKTLKTLATLDLPEEHFEPGNFRPSGSYFYQDSRDRVVIGTADKSVWVVSHHGGSFFTVEDTFDLSSVVPGDDKLQALQPDFSGRVWFTSKLGVVGTLDLSTGDVLGIHHLPAGERIVNGHSSDETGGVFIASTQAMYRFDADATGAPAVTWRETYDAGSRQKPGQVDIGTGTTPTLMGTDYVTITDNADPQMHVLVYRRAKTITGSRLTCSVPVFREGESATENSLVATDTSIVVENNYGYAGPSSTMGGQTTTPGITRIDIDASGTCRPMWTNESISIPSVVTKMSVANGLIYTYTKPQRDDLLDPWYVTAIDFRTGEVQYSQLAGTGVLYNNQYAALYLGPDGTVYVGVLGGIVAMHDIPRHPPAKAKVR